MPAQAAPTAARSLLPSTCLCAIVSVLGVCLSRSVFARIMQTEYTARAGGGRKARRNFIKTEKLSIKRSEQRIRPLYSPALPTVLKYILNGNPPVTT